MENMKESLDQTQTTFLLNLMTNNETLNRAEFCSLVSSGSNELNKLLKMLTLDSDLFVKIITDNIGSKRVQIILEISDEINTVLFFPIIGRFTDIMTHRSSYDLVSRILSVCNAAQIKIFNLITYRHAAVLARDENGCTTLKRVITRADDGFKYEFLDLIACNAFVLNVDELGDYSLIKHVLKLNFMHRTTKKNTRLHKMMAEFDTIILSNSDSDHLFELSSKLTSDSDLFIEFVKTMRGSLMVQLILGKSEETDMFFFEAIKKRFADVVTDRYGYNIVLCVSHVFKKRGNFEVRTQIHDNTALNALYLVNDPVGNLFVLQSIDGNNHIRTEILVSRLHRRFVELSFEEYGSNVVEKLLGECKSLLVLFVMVEKIVKSDKDTVVRLANDDYGNKVLKMTLELAKERSVDMFDKLVKKLLPCVGLLRGSQGENIVDIVYPDSETMLKDLIVSQRYI